MFRTTITAVVGAFAALALTAGTASANLITISTGQGEFTCTASCEAFTMGGAPGEPTGLGVLSSSIADTYPGSPSSEMDEADRLNTLAGTSFTGVDGTRTIGGGGSEVVMTLAEYVVLKVGSVAVYIKNTSGGLLTIDYTAFAGAGGGLSHYTEFGEVSDIPIPGAIWLMIAGIAGLSGASRKKKNV